MVAVTSGMELVAAELQQLLPPTRAIVAIDGPDGSGKSTFAERLGHHLGPRPVIIVHLDDFLNTAIVRHARGRFSPEGFWLDSYDYTAFCSSVLEPLDGNGDTWFRPACYDREADAFVVADPVLAPAHAVIMVEGLFLHREELAHRWTASVFLDVPFEETARRMAARDGTPADPLHSSMRRYVEGQRLYYAAARPWERASLVVDNSGPEPRMISASEVSAVRG